MRWSTRQTRLVRGTPLAGLVDGRASYTQRVFKEIIKPLFTDAFYCGDHLAGQAAAAAAPVVGFEIFEWALGMTLSRSFDFELSSPMPAWGRDTKSHRVMVPIADLFNHDHKTSARLAIATTKEGGVSMLELRTASRFAAGEQVMMMIICSFILTQWGN